MTVTIYGIRNCDTMKKARAWLDTNGIEYRFHDYKADGIDMTDLHRWCTDAGWEKLLNRAGTTFRKLPEDRKNDLDQNGAIFLMVEQSSMIKRPVVEADGKLFIGFKPEEYASLLT